jgi:hypothetical protein
MTNHLHLPMLFVLSTNLLLVVDSIQHYRKGLNVIVDAFFIHTALMLSTNIDRTVRYAMLSYAFVEHCRPDSTSSENMSSNRSRVHPIIPIHPSHISSDELQFIQNTLPTWLTEIEGKCSSKYCFVCHIADQLILS